MHRTLHDGWSLRPVAGPARHEIGAVSVPASVPGTVHTDLCSAGLIPDPYLDDHERRLAWIGLSDWCYETTFDWTGPADGSPDGSAEGPAADGVELVFDGLDTVARVELNGQLVAETRNMHRRFRFDVREWLAPGPNRLAVTFASAVRHADRASLELGPRPHVNHHPYNAIRKMACNFGWDWGPDLVTAGIWRPVTLHAWRGGRLAAVRPVTTVDGADGVVDVHLDLVAAASGLLVDVEVGGVRVTRPAADGDRIRVVVPEVRRWWPRGYGEPVLYDLTVTLRDGSSTCDEWRGRVGFRSLRLDVREDEAGTAVAFVVNDRPVFVKGANWIPDDAFPHRVTPRRYAARLAQAEQAGVNLLRVWGGGIYEADAFYDECDRRGIMTWQDFLFACAAYAEEEPLRSEVVAEARDNVTRLMPHPSLVLWNGNNENLWGHADWEWAPQLDGRTWGHGYYHEVLPAVVGELDPGRPYTAGSPWSFAEGRHPNDDRHGLTHLWDVWNRRDYPAYREHRPRFVAEFGWQGPPTWTTLRAAVSDDPLTPESPGLLAHQKATDGHTKLTRGLVPHLRVPSTMDDWHWAMSLNQARAVRTGVEYFRSLAPHCTGSIVWQLNDCWPSVSWAAVDSAGRRKPMFYALRLAHADRLVTVQPDGPGLRAVLVNDTDQPWSGSLELARRHLDGRVLAAVTVPVEVASRATYAEPVPAPVAGPDDPAAEVVTATLGPARGLWSFVDDRDADLPAPDVDASAAPVDGGFLVTVTARSFVKDLTLLVDRVDPDAVVDDALATLFPGESVTWTVHTGLDLDPATLLTPTTLRSANQLTTPAPPKGRAPS